MSKKKILWIPMECPYDGVQHGGGKVSNYSIKSVKKDGTFDVAVLCLYRNKESDVLDFDKYGIESHVACVDDSAWKTIIKEPFIIGRIINPFHKYAGAYDMYRVRMLEKMVASYKASGGRADIIVLEWSQIVLLTDMIKKYFPDAKIVSIEVDVQFQYYERKAASKKGKWNYWFFKGRYEKLRRLELDALHKSSLIGVNNFKDKDLLVDNGLLAEDIVEMCPYFDEHFGADKKFGGKDVLFLGAMGRVENSDSALWFIDNVFDRWLRDEGYRFVIVGSNPPASIKARASESIVVTGFVDDVTPYMENCLCMVAPLVMGAGVKIKVLEALSAGVPVLTNGIGIEGIAGVDGVSYMHCEKPEEYADAIRRLSDEPELAGRISAGALEMMRKGYNREASIKEFIERLGCL